jgi:transcriptional regulator with XRE-family HTH domain
MNQKELLAGVGRSIRQWRKKAGLTMAQLAEQAEVDAGFLAYIETGKKLPSLTTAAKLAAALGIRLADLFKDIPGERVDAGYQMERQVIVLLHGCSPDHKQAILGILKGLRDPKRLEALRQLIRD